MTETYDWAERAKGVDAGAPCTAEAACITVAETAREEDVLEALGVDPSSRRMATFHEAEGLWSEAATPVQIWTSGGKTIAIEPNGYLGSLPERLEKIAGAREVVSVYWNVNAVMQVLVVRDGVVVRQFDPLLYDEHSPLPEEVGLPFGAEGRALAAALAFLARRTGFVASEAEILGAKRATYLARAVRS
jgi:Family of unknown function (DUF6461)